MIRRALSLFLALSIAAAPLPALAQDKEACVGASENAQKLRKQKKLVAARKELVACAQEACPAVVKKDCVTWLAEVDDSLPSVILSAKDGSGNDLTDAKVLVDGEPFADKLDGSAMTIDPGAHVFKFVPATGEAVETKVVVLEAEKKRVVTVTIGEKPKPVVTPEPPKPEPPAAPPQPVETETRIPASAWALGGVAAVGFISFAVFGLAGRADRDHLLDTCAPYCSKDDEKPARNKLLVADISLGVGVVSLGVATVLILTAPKEPKKTALHVDAVPVAGGAVGMFGGSF